jgi:hypothetical protein
MHMILITFKNSFLLSFLLFGTTRNSSSTSYETSKLKVKPSEMPEITSLSSQQKLGLICISSSFTRILSQLMMTVTQKRKHQILL